MGGQSTKVLDRGSIELLGPYGLEKSLIKLSENFDSFNTGLVPEYGLYILIGLIFFLLLPAYLFLLVDNIFILIIFGLLCNIYTYNN